MKKPIFNFFFSISVVASGFLVSCYSSNQASKDKILVFSDEFNGSGLPDAAKWTFETGGDGFGNNELQYYTKDRLENARLENGNLIIEARKEKWDKNEYTSAKLVTQKTFPFQYGSVEVRAKLPKGVGTWPAIWMLSRDIKKWPDDGEIDIMEHVGYNHGVVHGSVHTKKYNHIIGTQKTDSIIVKNPSEKFHVYRADWSPDTIEMFVDNVKFFTYHNTEKSYEAWPFDQPFFLILNQAVGGNWGGKKGVDASVYPQKFYIDYVRIYKMNGQKN